MVPAQEDDRPTVEFESFTGRQKQMLSGSVELLGKKFKPLEETGKSLKQWFSVYTDEQASLAYEDITAGEPVIYCTADGVFIGTRYKRKKVRGGSVVKTAKEFDAFVEGLKPNDPLQSIEWRGKGNNPVSCNEYNLILAGAGWNAAIVDALPPCIAYLNTTSTDEIYDCFLSRRNDHHVSLFVLVADSNQADVAVVQVAEAEKLIDQMLVDVNKGEALPLIVCASMKHAAAARKNSMMKKVFVSEKKKQFVENVKADGEVDMVVIQGDCEGTRFMDFGGIVFELFYRVNLEDFMY